MTKEKVVLAYSGGLDTSVIVKWLQVERAFDVVAICGNVGQDERDLEPIRQKALDIGAVDSRAIDMRDEYAQDFLTRAVAANALYEGVYPLLSALSRPLISKHLVDVAHETGATYIAHGCTGKGNDQVRFETSIRALDPGLQIVAPVREWDMGSREEEMEWAAAHGVPVPTTKDKPYSIDDNLWGRAIECGVLEDTWNSPPDDIWTMTADPAVAPHDGEEVTIGFTEGVPTSINGTEMGMLDLVIHANDIAGRNGVGRIDMVEDRVVGIKSRECYECPGALLLIEAHKALEKLVLSAETLREKQHIDLSWADAVYRGLWYSQYREALDAFVAYTQRNVTGEVRMKLCCGGMFVDGLRSNRALYDYNLATYDPADTFEHAKSEGFIYVHGLPHITWSKVQGPGSGRE